MLQQIATTGRILYTACLLLLLNGITHNANAADIVFVVDDDIAITDTLSKPTNTNTILKDWPLQGKYRDLFQGFASTLDELGAEDIHLSVKTITQFKTYAAQRKPAALPTLIVTVGTEVTKEIAAMKHSMPTLGVLVPQVSFEAMLRNASKAAASHSKLAVIYLDQPLARHLNLIHLILPRSRRVGVMFGPSTIQYEAEFRNIAQANNFDLRVGKASSEGNLIAALDQLLDQSDAFLGIVDPLVFNRNSAQNVLLTAYRHRVPVIGISPAYVRAGAIASVYSTPTHLGRQLAETVYRFVRSGAKELPATQYPRYFSVAVNYQVADSLGIQLDDEDKLEHHLAGFEEAHQ
jgi:ABC-type uncharacterized transport system substrate-binding protein